jgi:hypothetical protein
MAVTTSIDILRVRRVMGKKRWGMPSRFGPDGWKMSQVDGKGSLIVTCSPHPDDPSGPEYLHASIAYTDHMPTYQDLKLLHEAVWWDGYAYQVFVSGLEHVNIHNQALHLWGRLDGQPMMPKFAVDFGRGLQI